MIAPPLVTLSYAKAHSHSLYYQADPDLAMKIQDASDIIMYHMKMTAIPSDWIVSSVPDTVLVGDYLPVIWDTTVSPAVKLGYLMVPGNVRAAVILVTAELFENREAGTSNPLSPAVLSMLEGWRDPTMA